jgi:small ligand-binding sensory domain FIST
MSSPHFACALSVEADSGTAEQSALADLEVALEGAAPDLVVAFATHHHGAALEGLGPRLARATGAAVVLGCTAESVIGGTREVEGSPGISLWAASLPGTSVRFFEVEARRSDGDEPEFSGLPPVGEPERASVLLLGDPFSFPVDPFLQRCNDELAGVPIMGGMASGAMGPGQSLLFTADGVREAGAIGAVLEGDIELCPVVSQGCRPVGKPWVITACERNLIHKLGGRPALEVLLETWHALPKGDQELMQGAPFVGLAIDPTQSEFDRGDFLVRAVMGLHQKSHAVAVADFVRRGQTVHFLVRDAASAGEDLQRLMASRGGGATPAERSTGVLIFSCNGRGRRMFPVGDHDVGCVRSALEPDAAVAGFFAAGEIGPIAGRNFLHGFTASVAVFRAGRAQGE